MSVRVLSRLFRRRFLEELLRVYQDGKLQFFGEHAALADVKAFKTWLTPLRRDFCTSFSTWSAVRFMSKPPAT